MAKTTVTVLTCDQCKAETGEDSEAEDSVEFGYDGYSYALDLCAPHAEGFIGDPGKPHPLFDLPVAK